MFVDEDRSTRCNRIGGTDSLDLGYARFLQTDPSGYDDGLNWYNYVGGDAVNGIDPSGRSVVCSDGTILSNKVRSKGDPCTDTGHRVLASIISGDDNGDPQQQSPSSPLSLSSLFPDFFPINSFGNIGNGLGVNYITPQSAVSGVRNFLCGAPQPSGGGGVDAYAGVGGSMAGSGSVNPRNGQFSIGFDLGVGVGLDGGGRYTIGKALGVGSPSAETAPIASAGLNANATLIADPVGGTGSYQLIGSNPGDYSVAYTGGAEVSGNINLSAYVQFNLPPLYSLDCK